MEQKASSKTKNWVLIIIGIIAIAAGFFSATKSETINNLFIEIGAGQVAVNVAEAYPEHRQVSAKIAYAIESAILARTTSTKELSDMIYKEVSEITDISDAQVSQLIDTIMKQINISFEVSETEAEYHAKLISLAKGLQAAVKK